VLKFTCPHCSQSLEAPEEASGSAFACPSCQQQIEVPMPAAVPAQSAASPPAPSGPVCAICLSTITDTDAKTSCPSCSATYHAECWNENGGCAVYGCSQAPVVESRRAIEIPMSYWGQENKNCPKCGQQILAAAVRCRHCGTTFASARPQEAEEFRQRADLAQRLPAARRTIVILFILSVLPCLAPIGAVWGFIWYFGHRDELRALPTLYSALSKIGLGVAIGQTVIMVLMTVLFTLLRS
jgi:predicted RNA-binding Zn-ribbon protein involved in translation (DUF1610 family)